MKVVVVGAGPAGLASAIALRAGGVPDVLVLEREPEAGGVPRHCDHLGFGLGDLRRVLGGPAYAHRYASTATRAGVEIRTETTVTAWAEPPALHATSPRGIETIAADAVLLATGCRERPRSARLVAGTRPAGVFTTGSLQQLVHLHHARVGRRAVVVGAEHVSFSAVLTLAAAGCETVALVTEHRHHQTYPPLAWWTAGRRRVPVVAGARVAEIHGHGRVDGVVLEDGRTLACDTVVFTGDWIPDHELARRGDIPIDAGTLGPSVDQAGRTQVVGVFAAGNLVHAAETAAVAALNGRAAATAIAGFLRDGAWPRRRVAIAGEPPIRWVWPNALAADAPTPSLLFRVDRWVDGAVVELTQDGRPLWRSRRRTLVPARSLRVPARALARIDPDGGALRVVTRS
jgi:thioredoxin reductase